MVHRKIAARCLIEGCERDAKTRGLCKSCYQTACKAVKADKTTWEELESMGLVLKAKRLKGIDNESPFRVALEKKQAEPAKPQPPADDVSAPPPADDAPAGQVRSPWYGDLPQAPDPRTIRQELDVQPPPPTIDPADPPALEPVSVPIEDPPAYPPTEPEAQQPPEMTPEEFRAKKDVMPPAQPEQPVVPPWQQ